MDKKSPKGRKRSSKGGGEESFWDCSVCTFRNNAEAFKCSMCDVRKGTSTRKPRLNPDLVAQQQAQALTPPPPPTSSTPTPSSSGQATISKPPSDEEEEEEESPPPKVKKPKEKTTPKLKKKELNKKSPGRPRLKNIDRSSATYHSVTVNDFTVVITEYKAKPPKKEKKKPTDGGAATEVKKEETNGTAPSTISQPEEASASAVASPSQNSAVAVRNEGDSRSS